MNAIAITPITPVNASAPVTRITQAPSSRTASARSASVRPTSVRPASVRPASVRPTVQGAANAGGLRLTRRGRMVVLLAALAFVLVLGILLGGVSTASEEAGVARPTEVVVVDDGDSLWTIAADVADAGEVRSMMKEIERLNALESPALMAGQKLLVPVNE